MEGSAPLDPDSGGTPTAMVAVPMLSTALGQRFSILGGTGTGTKMEASIHLRAKDFAAHERWLANLADVITSNGLDDLWENQQCGSRDTAQTDVAIRYLCIGSGVSRARAVCLVPADRAF